MQTTADEGGAERSVHASGQKQAQVVGIIHGGMSERAEADSRQFQTVVANRASADSAVARGRGWRVELKVCYVTQCGLQQVVGQQQAAGCEAGCDRLTGM